MGLVTRALALASSALAGAMSSIGAANTILRSDGTTPGGVWGTIDNVAMIADALITGAKIAASTISGSKLAPLTSNRGILEVMVIACPAGGAAGTSDDVTIAAPGFNYQITDVAFFVTTAVGSSTATLRTAAAGGGTQISSTMPTATPNVYNRSSRLSGPTVNNVDIFLNRSDRSVVGVLYIQFVRMP